ncbi:MAG: helix-turn-helix transcriptional regulator [Clostridia bacterium]
MEIKKIIGKNLAKARKDKLLTQKQLAENWGMPREQYGKYERGIIELNYTQIVYLCNILDITPNDLFYGTIANI